MTTALAAPIPPAPIPPAPVPPASLHPAGGERWGRIPAWWLDHPDLDADGLAVLAALSTYADDSGVCWPSQTTLAAKLKRSRPTVNRLLGRLDSLGLVTIEHRRAANGGRLSCRYRLTLSQPVTDPASEPARTRNAAHPIGPLFASRPGLRPDSPMDSPCPPASQEQPESEQIPDSPDGHADTRRAGMTNQPAHQPTDDRQDVPADWSPGEADRLWAEARFPDADLTRHAERFVQQCRAHGYRYRDAGAAWRSWLLQDFPETPATRNVASAHRKPAAPPAAARQAEAERRLSAWAAAAARLATPVSTATTWGLG